MSPLELECCLHLLLFFSLLSSLPLFFQITEIINISWICVNGTLKSAKGSVTLGGNELSRFSDPPGDASLDDLFHPLDKNPDDRAAEASTSTSTSHVNQGNASVIEAGKNDLATKLRATIAQKQMESDIGQKNGGGDLFRLMMGVLKDDVIDIDGLVCFKYVAFFSKIFFSFSVVEFKIIDSIFFFCMLCQVFDEKLPAENLFPLQVL